MGMDCPELDLQMHFYKSTKQRASSAAGVIKVDVNMLTLTPFHTLLTKLNSK